MRESLKRLADIPGIKKAIDRGLGSEGKLVVLNVRFLVTAGTCP